MELKEYQAAALEAFTRWLDALSAAEAQSEAVVANWPEAGGRIPDEILNYPRTA